MEQKNKKKIIDRIEDLRIEEEITSHMEENCFSPDDHEGYGDWLDSFIDTQKGLLK